MSKPEKFKKKPAVIEAFQYNTPQDAVNIVDWMMDNGNLSARASMMLGDHATPRYQIVIPTLDSIAYAYVGDWVIKGVEGEFYPCQPRIFEATYEPSAE